MNQMIRSFPEFLLATSLLLSLASCINDTPYQKNYTSLVINLEGQGEVLVEAENLVPGICTPFLSECAVGFPKSEAEVATLTATAYDGYRFAGWTGDVKTDDPVLRVTMTKRVEVVASFVTDAP